MTCHDLLFRTLTGVSSVKLFASVVCLALPVLFLRPVSAQEWKSGVEWQDPPVVVPGTEDRDAPSDAVILFDGTSLSQWENAEQWLVQDGVAIPNGGDIHSKRRFGDIQLHIEWSSPTEIKGEGQGRGNSGIFLMDRYEIQILDSWKNITYYDGQASSVYKQTPPMANAMRKPGEWNSYDAFFTAPRFRTNGDLETPGYVTVVHNGVLTLNHFELMGPTNYVEAPHYVAHAETGPIRLQWHRDAVRFRNIWVRELHLPVGRRTRSPFNIEPNSRPAAEPAAMKTPVTPNETAGDATGKHDGT